MYSTIAPACSRPPSAPAWALQMPLCNIDSNRHSVSRADINPPLITPNFRGHTTPCRGEHKARDPQTESTAAHVHNCPIEGHSSPDTYIDWLDPRDSSRSTIAGLSARCPNFKWTWHCHYAFQYSFPNILNDKGTKEYNELVNILYLLDLYGNTRQLAHYSWIVRLFHLHFLQFFVPSNTTSQSSFHLQDSPFISTLWYTA